MEAFLETFFNEILITGIKFIGALIRWVFQPKKTFKRVLDQQWNTTVGLCFIFTVGLTLIIIYN